MTQLELSHILLGCGVTTQKNGTRIFTAIKTLYLASVGSSLLKIIVHIVEIVPSKPSKY